VKWLRSVSQWTRAQLARVWPRPYRELPVAEKLPKKLKRRVLYVVQEDGFEEQAAMICPCGCGAVLHMNLLPDERPCWTLTRHDDRTVSLAPSVWRQKACGSHFFLRHGRIQWCFPADRAGPMGA
jgi:hypothetical protein